MNTTGDQPTEPKPPLAIEKVDSVTDSTVHETVAKEELCVVEALRRGDEAAFLSLIEQFHATMIRIARNYVANHDMAEEVVQETWIGVLHGLDSFESRSSLKTWIFHILINRAKSCAAKEARSVTFADIVNVQENELTVDPDCFQANGWWRLHPNRWDNWIEQDILWQEGYSYIQRAMQRLPLNQRTVMNLRDIEGWTALEVCETLQLSEENQRVLLHRARAKVRRALEGYFDKRSEI